MTRKDTHLRRWGAVYLLFSFFLISWVGQFLTQVAQVRNEAKAHGSSFTWSEFWPEFWSATFENWQSEWLQLAVQALVVVGYAELMFRKSIEDQKITRGMVEDVHRALGLDRS